MRGLPELSEIREAQALLANYFSATPLAVAQTLSRPDSEVYLKVETGLPTGSFKPRGAVYALATNQKRRHIREVTASSTGNHGAAVAYAAKELGLQATIFLPEKANSIKRQKIEDLGARVISKGRDIAAAFGFAQEYSRRSGVYFLNDATDPVLPAGAGTIGLEIVERLPNVSAVFVPMGDTALIRGIGSAIKNLVPNVRVVGVQAEKAASYVLSWREGRPVPTDSCNTCADGLATRTPDAGNVAAIRQVVDDVVLVSEAGMIEAIKRLSRDEHVRTEPAGAATTAAWVDHPISGRVVLLLTGRNISDEVRRQAGI